MDIQAKKMHTEKNKIENLNDKVVIYCEKNNIRLEAKNIAAEKNDISKEGKPSRFVVHQGVMGHNQVRENIFPHTKPGAL
jgi:hypothetical protein